MKSLGVSRRTALAAIAGAVAAPTIARAQAAGELRTVIQFGISYLPLMMIAEEKLLGAKLAQMGEPAVELKLQRVSGSNAVNEGLLAGTADMGVMGVPSLLIITEKSRGAVKGLTNASSFPMVLNTVSDRIKSLTDFKATDRIATPAPTSPQTLILRMAAEKELGDAKKLDTNVVSMPHPEAMAAMLSGTEVVAHFTNAPFAQYERQDKRVSQVLSSKDVLGGTATFVLLAANTRYVDKNPKVAEAMVSAMDEAMKRIKADPEKAAAIYLRQEPSKISPEMVRKIIEEPDNVFQVAPGGIMAYADFMQRNGQIKAKPASWQDTFFPFIHQQQGS